MYSRFKTSVAKNVAIEPAQSAKEDKKPRLHIAEKPQPKVSNEDLTKAEEKIAVLLKIIQVASSHSDSAKTAIEEASSHLAVESLMGINLTSTKIAESKLNSDEVIDQHGIEKILGMCEKWVNVRLEHSPQPDLDVPAEQTSVCI